MNSASQPISRFTPSDIPDLSGTNAIITGANSGIGFFTALELARHGANVTLAVRSTDKGNAAAEKIRSQLRPPQNTASSAAPLPQPGTLDVLPLDLISLASVETFSAAYCATKRPLHLLINNAGIMALPKRTLSPDGFEAQFATNVLGHFALTARLFPAILAAATPASPSRIVTVASIAHKSGKIRLDDLTFTSGYKPMVAYSQTKLANVMFAFELDRRLRAAGLNVLSTAAHPGVASTNLFQGSHYIAPERAMRRFIAGVIGVVLNSTAQGALPTLYAAASPNAKSGEYYGPTGFQEMRGPLGLASIAPQAKDTAVAAALWQKCEALTGCKLL
jgi:NAD(P)-dependent dehydrogenase (short-subunit alcohol dehydrogenase family)